MPAYIHIEKQEVIDKIRAGFNVKQIAEQFGIHRQTLIGKMQQWQLNQQKIKFNHDFFENIDCEEKAYWLGFLMADGCVQVITSFKSRISLYISAKDLEHLKKWHKSINSINKIYTKLNGNNLMSMSQHYSKKMAQDLINLGCTPRKTHTCQFPNIRQDLINHFVRGYFDGDGCAYWNLMKKHITPQLQLSICGTYDFLTKLKEILNINTKLNFHTNIYVLSAAGNKQCKKIVDWMYKDATIYLQRKYDKIYKEGAF